MCNLLLLFHFVSRRTRGVFQSAIFYVTISTVIHHALLEHYRYRYTVTQGATIKWSGGGCGFLSEPEKQFVVFSKQRYFFHARILKYVYQSLSRNIVFVRSKTWAEKFFSKNPHPPPYHLMVAPLVHNARIIVY